MRALLLHGAAACCCSNFLIYEIEAAGEAAPAIFVGNPVANIGYNLGDKAVFSPANYHLLRRYRNPVSAIPAAAPRIPYPMRGHHLPSGDNYAALIFNWVTSSMVITLIHHLQYNPYISIPREQYLINVNTFSNTKKFLLPMDYGPNDENILKMGVRQQNPMKPSPLNQNV